MQNKLYVQIHRNERKQPVIFSANSDTFDIQTVLIYGMSFNMNSMSGMCMFVLTTGIGCV